MDTQPTRDGWSTFQNPTTKQWQWSAYGPNGGSHGLAHSASEARMRATRAAADLKRPRKTEED